jgi:peptidyl-prolyl cis-trans isomerase B (cyclophilin B)
VSPSKQEREYARRRYEKWQTKQADRARVRAKRRRASILAAVGAVAVVAVVLGAWLVAGGGEDPEASPSATASGTCPEPTSTPVESPSQWPTAPPASDATGKTYQLTLTTSCGDVVLSLDGTKAPQAVASTVFLAQQGFFDSTRCHRLTTSGIYVLQCGDPTQTGTGGPGYDYGPVENAPTDDLYPAGTVAMARQGGKGDSMGSQFFLVYQDSTIPSDAAGGYTVLGTITGGLDVVQKIAEAGVTGTTGDGAPTTPVSIESVTVTEG